MRLPGQSTRHLFRLFGIMYIASCVIFPTPSLALTCMWFLYIKQMIPKSRTDYRGFTKLLLSLYLCPFYLLWPPTKSDLNHPRFYRVFALRFRLTSHLIPDQDELSRV